MTRAAKPILPLLLVVSGILSAADSVAIQTGETIAIPRDTTVSTYLLFPFLSTKGGDESEVAISNTTRDHAGTNPQSGTCTLDFYGTGTVLTQVTSSIAAGGQLVLRLSTGGGDITATEFQGYATARCTFPLARGFGKVSHAGGAVFSTDARLISSSVARPSQQALLFPYVTGQTPADTQIRIANTSLDPFGTSPKAASCSLTFYGTHAPATISTGIIDPGAEVSIPASLVAPGFQGYTVALCDFPSAAGIAHLSTIGSERSSLTEVAESLNEHRLPASGQLLFPFIPRENTTIVILNASADPLGTTPAAGSCGLSFHGTHVPSALNTGTIDAGSFFKVDTATLAPDFEGYVGATCSFPGAIGVAFPAGWQIASDAGFEVAEFIATPRAAGRSSILFPAIVSRNGTDAVFDIVNTSLDPWGTSPAAGTCTISYFGEVADGREVAAPQVSTAIPPGGQLKFTVARGHPEMGIAPAGGFRGYVIADCGFPQARGVARLTTTLRTTADVLKSNKRSTGSTAGADSSHGASVSRTSSVQQYVIATYAGGLPPQTAAMATSYSLGVVEAVVSDRSGNIYMSSDRHCVFKLDRNGILSRVAGNGHAGFSGDGGPAVNAQLFGPQGLALDSAGNLYIADEYNNRIRMVTGTGIITTVAGNGAADFAGDGGPATAAALNMPMGVALDSAGSLYISDTINSRIRKVTGGTISTIAGTGDQGYSGDGSAAVLARLWAPNGIVVDPLGYIYIADKYNNVVRQITPDGIITTFAGTGTYGDLGDFSAATSAQLRFPVGLALDPGGRLYIVSGSSLRMVDLAGRILPIAGTYNTGFYGDGGPVFEAGFSGPVGVTVDPAGNLYIADGVRVRELSISGIASTVAGSGADLSTGDGGIATLATFFDNRGIALASDGALFVVDSDRCLVRKISQSGTVTAFAGNGTCGYSGDGHAAVDASIVASSIAVDAAGNVYIGGGARVRKISTKGTITLVAGTGVEGYSGDNDSAKQATFSSNIYGLAIDAAGNLFIADSGNDCIRKVNIIDGVVTTVAGSGSYGSSGDGGAGASAMLNDPEQLGFDGAGNLYIADVYNFKIRKLASNGIITTVAGTGVHGYSGDGGAAASAQLDYTGSLAVDPAGNIYIGTQAYSVRKISAGGVIATIAGSSAGAYGYTGDGGDAALALTSLVLGLAADSLGNVFVSTQDFRPHNNSLRLLEPAGTESLLSAAVTHSGNFALAQTGATYTISVGNAALASSSSGTVTVTDTIPPGLHLVNMDGPGWSCSANTCTREESLAPGASYQPITVTVNVSSGALPQVTNVVTVSGGGSIATTSLDVTFVGPSAPALSITARDSAYLFQGQQGATYTLCIDNQTAAVATSGTVTVTEILPAGMTFVSMNGPGWQCGTDTCTRNDSLPGGAYYPPIVVTVNVSATASSPQLYTATVSGGGTSTPATTNDLTSIYLAPVLTLSLTHPANFVQSQMNAQYTVTLGDAAGDAPTTGELVTVQETVPPGLTLVSMAGNGWNCPTGGTTCTRIGRVGPGSTYPPITVTVNVAADAPGQVDNIVKAWGGGAALATATDTTKLDAPAYMISTYAGATALSTPAPASSYYLGDSFGPVVTDHSGNVYLVATNSVFKINSSGMIFRIAGTGIAGSSGDGGPAISAQLNHPGSLAVDNAGNIYVADSINWRIRKISNGIISTVAGNGSSGYSGDGGLAVHASFSSAPSVAVDAVGNLYIADESANRVRKVALDGTISTFAGNGSPSDTGDGGLASSAGIPSPHGLLVSSSGEIYIATGARVRKVSPTGIITAFAGTTTAGFDGDGGPARNALLNAPAGLAMDSVGDIFIADNNRVRKVDINGVINTVAGRGSGCCYWDGQPATLTYVYGPAGMAADDVGQLYLTFDTGLHRVSLDGLIHTITADTPYGGDNGPAPFALFNRPQGLALDSSGDLFVADRFNSLVRKVSTDGVVTTAYSVSGDALAIDPAGSLFLASYGTINKLNPDGTRTPIAGNGVGGYSGDGGSALAAQIPNSINGMAFDPHGNLYISDNVTHRVRKITPGGTITTIAGNGFYSYDGDGGLATNAHLNQPNGLAVDRSGNLYIADTYNFSVRRVSPNGIITTIAGSGYPGATGDGGPATKAQLLYPTTVAVDPSGNILIGCTDTIRGVTSDGTIWTVAGPGSGGRSGDGGPALFATIGTPQGMVAAPSGAILFSSGVIRLMQPTGTLPFLTVGLSHNGDFAYGQQGAQYTINVANGHWSGPTAGAVTVTEMIPDGLTLVSMKGDGWNCSSNICSRSDALTRGANYAPITVTVNVSGSALQQATNQVTLSGGGALPTAASDLTLINSSAILTILLSHAGTFSLGQSNAMYTLTVPNQSSKPTVGMVTVSETLPDALTLVSMKGNGWDCDSGSCTRSDVLPAGSSYPPIVVTVAVASSAPSQVVYQATVSGGGSPQASASDTTMIYPLPTTLSIGMTPPAYLTQGQKNATYTVTVSNVASGAPTVDTVTLTATLPASLTFVSLKGAGWKCVAAACTRGDSLPGGQTYASITLTVNVASNAPAQVTTQVDVSGGGASPATATTSVGVDVPAIQYLISTYAGGLATPTAANALSYPLADVRGVTTDRLGNVYILSGLQCVFKVSPQSILTRVAGTCHAGFSGDAGLAVKAQINDAAGLATDSSGNLYIADKGNNRVRMVSPGGIIFTVAGNGSSGYAGENVPATSTPLREPAGVAVDSAGILYIADSASHSIRTVKAGMITTLAGTGAYGYSGDRGLAVKAQLHSPMALAIDAFGTLYVADSGNMRVRAIAPNGIITTVAGTGTAGFSGDSGDATSAQLSDPEGVAVDSSGNLYIADDLRVRKVDTNGKITTVAGSGICCSLGDGGAATSAWLQAGGVATDQSGTLFIADTNDFRVRKVTGATISTYAGTGGYPFGGDGNDSTLAQFTGIGGMALDPSGNLYVADARNYRIRKVSPDGTVNTAFIAGTCCGPQMPNALTADSQGNIYFSVGPRIWKMTGGAVTLVAGTGTAGYSGDNALATAAQLSSSVNGLAVDSQGNLFLADTYNSVVRRVTRAGVITTVAGTGVLGYAGDGLAGPGALLANPMGLAFDAAGSLYIADSWNCRIRALSVGGIISTVAGTGSCSAAGDGGLASNADLYVPETVATDATGNLFLGGIDGTIRRVSPRGIITTIAGVGTPGFGGDGGPALAAQLSGSGALVADGSGNLYLSDFSNNEVRLLQPAGVRPLLTVDATHSSNFVYGQTGAKYSLTVSNVALAGPVTGAVSVTETVPAGLTLSGMSGSGWDCPANTCTRSGPLAAGASYPPITVTVDVAATTYPQLTNLATVSGGGAATSSVADPTFVSRFSCDTSADGFTNVADVQQMMNEVMAPSGATHDLNLDGAVNVVDVQLVINAAFGLGCPVYPQ